MIRKCVVINPSIPGSVQRTDLYILYVSFPGAPYVVTALEVITN